MGLTREDLRDKKWTEQDKKEIAVVLERYQQNDEWALKTRKKVAVLLTSHPGNRPYLKASVESHKKLGYWVVLAYDNYINPANKDIDYNKVMPVKDVMDNVDTFLMPHHQVWGGVLYPYFWLMKFGVNLLQDFEYIYCANGDMVIEKPEGFPEIMKLMGDADIMGTGPDTDRIFNTAGFIAKSGPLRKMMAHFEKHLIPFENYEKYTQEFGNTEGRLARAIADLKLKRVIMKEPPSTEQLHMSNTGTWCKILGFRHIHAELNYAYRYKGIPPEIKYLDERFTGGDYGVIKKYWETKDKKILEAWWAKDG